jgi:hypothetical protein
VKFHNVKEYMGASITYVTTDDGKMVGHIETNVFRIDHTASWTPKFVPAPSHPRDTYQMSAEDLLQIAERIRAEDIHFQTRKHYEQKADPTPYIEVPFAEGSVDISFDDRVGTVILNTSRKAVTGETYYEQRSITSEALHSMAVHKDRVTMFRWRKLRLPMAVGGHVPAAQEAK